MRTNVAGWPHPLPPHSLVPKHLAHETDSFPGLSAQLLCHHASDTKAVDITMVYELIRTAFMYSERFLVCLIGSEM